jgi:hypothetical protein
MRAVHEATLLLSFRLRGNYGAGFRCGRSSISTDIPGFNLKLTRVLAFDKPEASPRGVDGRRRRPARSSEIAPIDKTQAVIA